MNNSKFKIKQINNQYLIPYTQREFYSNSEKLDGTIIKLTNTLKLHNLGWKHKVELEERIEIVYEWHKKLL